MSTNYVPRKKLSWRKHLAAFFLTGGASAGWTATRALANDSYNQRERKAASQGRTTPAAWRADHVPGSAEYKAKHGA